MNDQPIGVKVRGLGHRFGSVTALEDVTCELRRGKVTGLVGRNGAGKTTLLSLIAGLHHVQQGEIRADGKQVWENAAVTSQICLMREKGGIWEDAKTRETLMLMADLRPNWDVDYCLQLLDRFEVRLKGKPEQLSSGKRAALGVAIGLASRAPLTIFDEVYHGMDAVARRMFYEELMAEYAARPRTIVISSHLLDEVEDLMEDVIVLHRGSVALTGEADVVRAKYSKEDSLASLTDVLIAVSGRSEGAEQ